MAITPKVTVGWCRECLIYEQPYSTGMSCPMNCDRTLVKRVGYICEVVAVPFGYAMRMPCSMVHWTVKSMKECKHDAY